MVFEAFEDVAEHLLASSRRSALGYLSPQQFEDEHIRQFGKSAA
jgi:putative transposase